VDRRKAGYGLCRNRAALPHWNRDDDDVTGARLTIFPVLLSGGAGSRLWPLSRESAPKQLLRLFGEETLLQQAVLRASDVELFEPLTIIAGAEHRAMLTKQLGAVGAGATILLEPAPRSTAAAAAISALMVSRSRPDALLLLMPTDHLIDDAAAFRKSVREAADIARNGHLVLFGVKPDRAATGYGYIRVGAPLDASGPARQVAGFVEKPDEATAEAYLASGDYLWNSGIFLMPVEELLTELRAFEPDLLAAAGEALEHATLDADCLVLEPQAFQRCRSVSIDYAIMERTGKAAVVAAEFNWTDVGSWSALWSIAERDETGNAAIGDVLTWATHESYIRSEGPLVATLGVDNLIVVATKDAVLVARRGDDQEIRKIVEHLLRHKPERA
jgi:mannose-1-phosphate guanylyltransferase/mannose-1-phosphate guanylyltransferase/mannose-6-phosphate isomerase